MPTNRADRRARARSERREPGRSGRRAAALGSAAVLASTAGGAAVALTGGPAGALAPSLVVNSLADTSDGTCDVTNCTLREAITAANTAGGQDTITFSVTGTITLTADLPSVTEAIHLDGPGRTALTIDGTDQWRVLQFDNIDWDTIEVADLTITNGDGSSNVFQGGGAIALVSTDANVLIEDVTLSSNTAPEDGGAVQVMYGSGDLTVNRSSIVGSSTPNDGGGLYVHHKGGTRADTTVTITDSTISGNYAHDYGGGLFLYNVTATITNTTIADNVSYYYSAGGGGIAARNVDLTVVGSTIAGNAAGYGGGVYLDFGSITIANSTITGNSGQYYGAITSARIPAVTLDQVTITGNTTAGSASAAIRIAGSANTISGSIIVGNTADGHAADIRGVGIGTTATVDASLVGAVNSGAFTSWNATGGTQTGVTPAQVALGPLADNGGPTRTMALGAGSLAIDAGPDPVATFPGNTFDQRGTGFPRVSGATADAGAFEVQPAGPPPPTALIVTGPAPGSRSVGLSWTAPTGPTPDGYQIRCLPQGFPFDIGPGGKVVYVGSTTNSVTVPGLTGGETYVCYVRARYGPQYFSWLGDAHEGPPSDPSAPFTVARTAPPVPGRVTASTPPQPTGQATAVGFVQPENRSGAAISRFDARCTSTNGGTTRTGSGATSPVGVTNLSRGRTYSCVVSAVNSIGPSTWSAPSDRIVVPAGPVTDVRASTPTTNRRTTVTFTPPAGGPTPVRYWVECRTTDGSSTLTASGPRSPVTVANLVRGRTYTCRVWAIFGSGAAGPVSSPSNSIGVP